LLLLIATAQAQVGTVKVLAKSCWLPPLLLPRLAGGTAVTWGRGARMAGRSPTRLKASSTTT
jgi:hypothetical protein